MNHNIPQLFYFKDEDIDAVIKKYQEGTPKILDTLSLDGILRKVDYVRIDFNPVSKQYMAIVSISVDELKSERLEMMKMAKQAICMIGGDPNCDHQYESTEEGLICSKCGGKLP